MKKLSYKKYLKTSGKIDANKDAKAAGRIVAEKLLGQNLTILPTSWGLMNI